jgi:hypothetical protein
MGTAKMDVKGEFLIVLQRYIDEKFDKAARARVREGLSSTTASMLPSVKPAEYYPLACATELFHGIDVAIGDPQKTFDSISDFGQYLAGDAMSTYMKLLFKILTPGLLTAKFPSAYKRYYRNGDLVADVSRIKENKVSFTCEGHDYLHAEATGWILYVYGQLGMKNIQVKTNVALGQVNIPGPLRWDVSWD